MRALILSITAYKSVENPSMNIKGYLESRNHTVEIIDIVKYAEDIIDELIKDGSMERISPIGINGILHTNRHREKESGNISSLLSIMLSSRLGKYIDGFQPDVIISTHSFGLRLLNSVFSRKNIDASVILIADSSYLENPVSYEFIDAYIIPDEYFRQSLTDIGIDPVRIYPLGMPVSKQFIDISGQMPDNMKPGHDSVNRLLVAGEGLSRHTIINMFQSIINSHMETRICALIDNPVLKEHLYDMARESPVSLNILCSADMTPQLLYSSRLIITRPNWITINEAHIIGLPVMLISPAPLSDRKSISCLKESGTAVFIDDSAVTSEAISKLLGQPLKLQEMKVNDSIKAKPDAGYNIANLVETFNKIHRSYFSS